MDNYLTPYENVSLTIFLLHFVSLEGFFDKDLEE
jgi:hypothetical protein